MMTPPNTIRDVLARQAEAADRATATDAGLWVLTIFLALFLLVWAVLGGAAAADRLLVLARLWPLAGVWMFGLAWRGRGLAKTRQEIARACAMIGMTDRAIPDRTGDRTGAAG